MEATRIVAGSSILLLYLVVLRCMNNLPLVAEFVPSPARIYSAHPAEPCVNMVIFVHNS